MLLSTSKFTESGTKTNSQTDTINNLRDAYDVYYGEQENNVKDAIQLHEDETNKTYDNSTTVIEALRAQWALQTQYNSAIADAKTQISDYNDKLDVQRDLLDTERTELGNNKTILDSLYTKALQDIQTMIDKQKELIGVGGSTITPPSDTGEGGGGGQSPTKLYKYYFVNTQYKYRAERSASSKNNAISMLPTTFPNGKKAGWNQTTESKYHASYAGYTFLAKGGIVNSPTMAMIGEAGPEAVVPLTKNILSGVSDTSGKLGGANINISSINISGVATNDPNDFAYEFAKSLRRELRTR